MKHTPYDIEILAKTIYGEARGEFIKFGITSLIAVAYVVVNRVKKRMAPTIHDACLAPFQFSCWNKNDVNYLKIQQIEPTSSVYKKCVAVAQHVAEESWPDITDGCDHYHSKSIKPYWAAHRLPKKIFGTHLFYCLNERK